MAVQTRSLFLSILFLLGNLFGEVEMVFPIAEKNISVRSAQFGVGSQVRSLPTKTIDAAGLYDLQDDSRQPESVVAVLKVFGIMQALSEQKVIGISEVSQRLAMPKATVYRFLQTMKSLGYVQQEQEGERYGLSMRMFELGCKALEFPDLLQIAGREMAALSQTCMESLHLGTLVEDQAVYIHKTPSPRMLGLNTQIGKRIPLHCTATGKVLLAFSSSMTREKLLDSLEFTPLQASTHTSATTLTTELDRIHAQGYAVDMQEYDPDICCFAVPVLDYLNNVVAGLSMTLPVIRYNSIRQEENIDLLHQSAREISRQLGCTDYPF